MHFFLMDLLCLISYPIHNILSWLQNQNLQVCFYICVLLVSDVLLVIPVREFPIQG